jgi:5-hydroxyisourate hydrolase
MSAVTTHVLDTALGGPGVGVSVRLEAVTADRVTVVATGITDDAGRISELGPDRIEPGTYRLVLDTAGYLASTTETCFFPEVAITFVLADSAQHYHVPVLLSPFAYSTYRGS